MSDSTIGNLTIFHFSQSFSFQLFLFLVTAFSTFSGYALQSFQPVQKQFFNQLIYLRSGSIESSFLAHKKHTPVYVSKFA